MNKNIEWILFKKIAAAIQAKPKRKAVRPAYLFDIEPR